MRRTPDAPFVDSRDHIEAAWLRWLLSLDFGLWVRDIRANRTNYHPRKYKNRPYLETDTRLIYVSDGVDWKYAVGVWRGLLADRPTSPTIGVNDTGLMFSTTNTAERFYWTGSVWIEDYQLTDAATNSVTRLLRLVHLTSGTAAAGFGSGLLVQLEDASGNTDDASAVDTTWTTPTHGAEASDWTLKLRTAGAALAKAFRVFAGGAVELIGKISKYNNAAPTDGQLLIGHTANGTLEAATLTGTAAQVKVTNGAGAITLALEDDVEIVGDLAVGGDLDVAGAMTFADLEVTNLEVTGTLTASTIAGPASASIEMKTLVAGDLTLTAADDLVLRYGAGKNVKFGTHSAIAAETVTGYITIKDAAGNTRKLAVVS